MKSRDAVVVEGNVRRSILIVLLFALPFLGVQLKAQNTLPEGLHLNKTWEPTNELGTEGVITLEAFVTGQELIIESHAPTDIALVLDASGSMDEGIAQVAYANLDRTKGAIEGYYIWRSGNNNYKVRYYNNEWQYYHYYSGLNFWNNGWRWDIISSPASQTYYISRMGALKDAVSLFVDNIKADAEQYDVDHRISIVKYAMNRFYNENEASVQEGNHTYTYNSSYGYEGNYTEVVVNRRPARTESAAIKNMMNAINSMGATASDYGMRKVHYLFEQIPASDTERSRVVVLFTDGSPTHGSTFDNTVASATILHSKEYKDVGAKVFTVGVFGGIPTSNVNTYMDYVSSNYPEATSMDYSGPLADPADFYMTADNADDLNNVFETIANSSASQPFTMNQNTIMQDQVSSIFQINGAASGVSLYAPNCTGVDPYTFEEPSSSNQLPDTWVHIEDDIVSVTGFDYTENWCGPIEQNGTTIGYHGKKLVLKVKLKIQEGIWGDNIVTNGPNSYILPNGEGDPFGFPFPTANVIGDVWPEIVIEAPNGFDPMDIDSPEDLAWFISVVNGRANYDHNNTVPPAPATNGRLTADIDMSAHNWVPIGSSKVVYTGTFDGNGHVITGLKNNASKFYKHNKTVLVYPGMFGRVGNNGVVKNVFVLDSDMCSMKHEQVKTHFGIIADTLDAGAQLYNCEAAGRLAIANSAENAVLVVAGLVGLNNGTIHSTMSMAQLTGYAMGGLIGENNGSISNSFANPSFRYFGGNDYLGGVAGKNTGTIDNCYVRLGREHKNLDASQFGQIAGQNTSVISHCFVPEGNDKPVAHTGDGTATTYPAVTAPYLYDYDAASQNAMLDALNANRGNGSEWKRTTAGKYDGMGGDINGDYPILKYDNFVCAASANGIVIDYSNSLSDMLKRHNLGNMNVNTALEGAVYQVSAHPTLKGGAVNLYRHCDNREGEVQNTEGVVVYIDENVSLLQGESSSIDAYTCQTLTKPNEYWHTISSSLSNSQLGILYGTTGQVAFSWEGNPCSVTYSSNHDQSLFPYDASVSATDIYCFYEPQYHWINLKRNSNSHWHMDAPEVQIAYTNETILTPGKGYLAAIDKETLLQNRGILNNGYVGIDIDYTHGNAWTGYNGHNLIGNPYQSYLDFEAFVNENTTLWAEGDRFYRTYSVYDAATNSYLQYQAGSSAGSMAASPYINMHQGFFIVKDREAGSVRFTNAMRTNAPGNGFRDNRPEFPLVNLIVSDANGVSDVAVLELDRSDVGGARKMQVTTGAARLYLRHDNENYAVLFRDDIENSQPLYFETTENGVYTLRWNLANDHFNKLILVDNIAGLSVDMLGNDHYLFTASTDDYKSRFKIFVDTEGNSPQVDNGDNFAFLHNGELIVNGEGRLDIVDVLGRVLFSSELQGAQNAVGMPSDLSGMYIIRLTDGADAKSQKIVL